MRRVRTLLLLMTRSQNKEHLMKNIACGLLIPGIVFCQVLFAFQSSTFQDPSTTQCPTTLDPSTTQCPSTLEPSTTQYPTTLEPSTTQYPSSRETSSHAMQFRNGFVTINRQNFNLTQGQLHFVFNPTGTAGTGGTWQPIVISPDGTYNEGPVIRYDSADPVDFVVADPWDSLRDPTPFIEYGCYEVMIKNAITNAVDANVVSSIRVSADCPVLQFDTITYRLIPPSSYGETVAIYHVLPLKNF